MKPAHRPERRAAASGQPDAEALAATDLLDSLCCAPEPRFAIPEGVTLRFAPMRTLATHAEALRALLDGQERARAAAIRYPGRALSFWGGRAVARLMLSSAAGGSVAPAAWRIVPDASGKPRVMPFPDDHSVISKTKTAQSPRGLSRFPLRSNGERVIPAGAGISITHAAGMLGVAVSLSGDVGLDLELLGGPCPEIPPEHLHPAELALLRMLPDHRRADMLFLFWTVKEAVAKCRGDGVTADFSLIDASPASVNGASFQAGRCDVLARSVTLDGRPYGIVLANPPQRRQ